MNISYSASLAHAIATTIEVHHAISVFKCKCPFVTVNFAPVVLDDLRGFVNQHKRPELNLGSFVLTDALARRMVKQSYAIGV